MKKEQLEKAQHMTFASKLIYHHQLCQYKENMASMLKAAEIQVTHTLPSRSLGTIFFFLIHVTFDVLAIYTLWQESLT